MTFVKRAWIAVVAFVLSSVVLYAQTGGTISGVVQDESSGAIPGATITVTNVNTGIMRTTVSDQGGRYRVPGLIPGEYAVQAELQGFQTAVRKGLTLNVGSEIEIPMVLKTGSIEETIEVTGAAPIVQTANATLGTVVEGETVRDLPLNGRSFDQLISLQSSSPTYRPQTGNGTIGMATAFTINGAWQTMNTYLMDGVEQVGGALMGTAPGGALGKNMGVDAVEEFKVLTGSYSAEFGKRAGAVVNIATRSGTNTFHGSGYEFHRDSQFDALNYFDARRTPFHRNQFGGTFGGPVRKDRTFFFGNYEGLRDLSTPSLVGVFPDDNARNGLLPCAVVTPLPNPCPASGLFNVGVNPTVAPFLELLSPHINGRNFGDGTGEYRIAKTQTGNQNYALGRIDNQMSKNHSLMARYNRSRSVSLTPNAAPKETPRSSTEYNVVLEEKWVVSPTVLNTIRGGYVSAFFLEDSVPTGAAKNPILAFWQGAPYSGNIAFSAGSVGQTAGVSGSPLSGLGQGAGGCCLDRHYGGNQYDLSDQLFLQRGAHALTIGGHFQKIQHNVNFNLGQLGTFSFASLQAFLQGIPTQFIGINPADPNCPLPAFTNFRGEKVNGCSSADKAYREKYFDTYFQDDYKLRRNLTLNLGVRYELMTVPFEINGRIANWRPETVNGILRVASTPTIGNPMFKGSRDLVAPRVGAAWDIRGNGRTALLAGWGVFYDELETNFQEEMANDPPDFNVISVPNPPFPLAFSRGASGGLPAAVGMDPNLKVPTRYQHNVSLQQQIGSNMAINVGYVGDRIVHLTHSVDMNWAVPQILPAGSPGCSLDPCYFFAPGSPARNPAVAATNILISDGKSWYQGAQMDWILRAYHGLNGRVSLTYAKTMDTNSNLDTALGGTFTPQNSDPSQLYTEKGLSAFDIRRNLVMNFTYLLPFDNALGRGWTIGVLGTFADGVPKTIFSGVNRAGDKSRNNAQRPNLLPGASGNPVKGGTLAQIATQYFDPSGFALPPVGFYGNLGRDTLIGPGYEDVDLTVEKALSIGATRKVLLRAEAFNLFNHVNFAQPNTTVFTSAGTLSPTAGQITSALPARQLQFGVKFTF
jgi:carboxypeptidase family protein